MLFMKLDMEQSEIALNRALSLEPFDPETLYAKANICVLQERYDEALIALDNAVATGKAPPDARWLHGHVLVKLDRNEEAFQTMRLVGTPPPTAVDALNVGCAAMAIDRYDDAAAAFSEALASCPVDDENYDIALAGAVAALVVSGRPSDAKALFSQAHATSAPTAAGLCRRGEAMLMLGMTEGAFLQFQKASEIDPHSVEVQNAVRLIAEWQQADGKVQRSVDVVLQLNTDRPAICMIVRR